MKKVSYKKLTPQQREELKEVVLMLRYGKTYDDRKKLPMLRCSAISKALKLPYNQVAHICKYKSVPEPKKKYNPQWRKLEQQHIDFLISPATLRLWAGKVMKERVILFHRQFVNKVISVTSLRRLYLKHRVKRKRVRQEKIKPETVKQLYGEERQRVISELELLAVR